MTQMFISRNLWLADVGMHSSSGRRVY